MILSPTRFGTSGNSFTRSSLTRAELQLRTP
jgi:hypothetical protein